MNMNKYIHSIDEIFDVHEDAMSILRNQFSSMHFSVLNYHNSLVVSLLSYYGLTLEQICKIGFDDVQGNKISGYDNIVLDERTTKFFDDYKYRIKTTYTTPTPNFVVLGKSYQVSQNPDENALRYLFKKQRYHNIDEVDAHREFLSPKNAYISFVLCAIRDICEKHKVSITDENGTSINFTPITIYKQEISDAIRQDITSNAGYNTFAVRYRPKFKEFAEEEYRMKNDISEPIISQPVAEPQPVVVSQPIAVPQQQVIETPAVDNSEILAEVESLEKDLLAMMGRITKLKSLIK